MYAFFEKKTKRGNKNTHTTQHNTTQQKIM